MALLNNIYIHVTDETVNRNVESTSHPVEKGIDITDTIHRQPITLSLAGMIVDYGDTTAATALRLVTSLQNEGSLISYRGRNVIDNLQIQSFNSTHPNTIHNGLSFTMELKQVRLVQSPYNPDNEEQRKEENEENKTNPVIKVGDTVKFTGGYVYISSDATNPSGGIRSSCECKVLKINTAAWASHQYCLEATDGTILQGWVDKSCIEGLGGTNTNKESKSSKQQIQTENTKQSEFYTTKSGDTVWDICETFAKEYGVPAWEFPSFNKKFMEENAKAFSEKGNPRTLKTGARVKIDKAYYIK